ncbi:Uncharacterised protein [Mycobacteroides abscessus subsp. abscessus]|nr:Uncharacterised protein [Mycobacteroides abscessus subsp. abscessus]
MAPSPERSSRKTVSWVMLGLPLISIRYASLSTDCARGHCGAVSLVMRFTCSMTILGSPPTQPRISKRTAAQCPAGIVPVFGAAP